MDIKTDNLPIAVDLDGTLIFNELSYISLRRFCMRYPWKILMLGLWLTKGVAYVKSRLAEHINIDPKTLSYNKLVLDYIKNHSAQRIILATGADQKYAREVAAYLGCFERVIASDGLTNTVGQNKADRLNALLGQGKYIYVGNSSQDISVWRQATYAVAVNAPESVLSDLRALNMPYEVLK
jgi:phosphoserine phosphatase